MKVRNTISTVATTALLVVGLAACSSTQNNTQASHPPRPVVAKCTEKGTWKQGLQNDNMNFTVLAKALSVDPVDVQNGGFGQATCDTAVPEDDMATSQPPIVSVGANGVCLAIGMQQMPVTGGTTKDIVALCPGSHG